MQLSMSVFEEYLTRFRKKVAKIEKNARAKKKELSEPKEVDDEFELELPFPGEEPEEVSTKEAVLFMFLKKELKLIKQVVISKPKMALMPLHYL